MLFRIRRQRSNTRCVGCSVFQAGLKKSVYESLFAFDLEQMRRLDQEALRSRIMALLSVLRA